MKTTGLRIAQVAAVVFAIGVSTWIVILAHDEANPDKNEGATPPEAGVPAGEGSQANGRPGDEALPYDPNDSFDQKEMTDEEIEEMVKKDPTFFSTSKSGMPFRAKKDDATPEKKKKPVFLPSSKSMPITEGLKPAEGAKPDAEKAKKAQGSK